VAVVAAASAACAGTLLVAPVVGLVVATVAAVVALSEWESRQRLQDHRERFRGQLRDPEPDPIPAGNPKPRSPANTARAEVKA
jgi:cysteine sulfinate desulfinase/cysteine desulfurase-like protein